jgi:hypothetical protein
MPEVCLHDELISGDFQFIEPDLAGLNLLIVQKIIIVKKISNPKDGK